MTSTPHVLVVDDDIRLRRLLGRYLREQGYAVSEAENAEDASRHLSLLRPDIMVLDVMMPGKTGLELATELREYPKTPPILMLTAMDTPQDRINGLESGVEDYLTKPFEPRELLLRLNNILKRYPPEPIYQQLRLGTYHYDMQSGKLTNIEGETVTLTTAEAQLLACLAKQSNHPVSRHLLSETLGLNAEEQDRAVDVSIGRLRKKLGQTGLIETVRGIGYKLNTL